MPGLLHTRPFRGRICSAFANAVIADGVGITALRPHVRRGVRQPSASASAEAKERAVR
jgi:hypothetical protein